MNVALDDIINSGVVSKEDLEWAASVRIPFPGSGGIWARKHLIDSAIADAIDSGTLQTKAPENIAGRTVYVISDDLKAGVNGLHNPADGKMYDSKSAYYKGVKAAGCVVMGTDAKAENRKELRGDYDCTKELKEALQQHLG